MTTSGGMARANFDLAYFPGFGILGFQKACRSGPNFRPLLAASTADLQV